MLKLSDELAAELKKPVGGDSVRIAKSIDELCNAAKCESGGQYRLAVWAAAFTDRAVTSIR